MRRRIVVAGIIFAAILVWPTIAVADFTQIYVQRAFFSPGQERSTPGFADRKTNFMFSWYSAPPNRPVRVYLRNTAGTILPGSDISGLNSVGWGPSGSWIYARAACKVPSPYSHEAQCGTLTRS